MAEQMYDTFTVKGTDRAEKETLTFLNGPAPSCGHFYMWSIRTATHTCRTAQCGLWRILFKTSMLK